MSKRYFNRDKSTGFTIIEVIIAISLFAVLLFATVDLFLNIFKNPRQEILSLDSIDRARTVTTNFSNELRNAATGNEGSYPLGQADNSQIIFYSSTGGNGTTINRIRYYLANNNLYKGVVVPSGNPLTYNSSSETITTLMTGLGNFTSPLFYYYDGNYNGSGPQLSPPININQVKFVRINLFVPRRLTAKDTSTFLVTAGVTIRNLKNNLGN